MCIQLSKSPHVGINTKWKTMTKGDYTKFLQTKYTNKKQVKTWVSVSEIITDGIPKRSHKLPAVGDRFPPSEFGKTAQSLVLGKTWGPWCLASRTESRQGEVTNRYHILHLQTRCLAIPDYPRDIAGQVCKHVCTRTSMSNTSTTKTTNKHLRTIRVHLGTFTSFVLFLIYWGDNF